MKLSLMLSSLSVVILIGAGCAVTDFESKANVVPSERTGIQLTYSNPVSGSVELQKYSEVINGTETGDDFMVMYKIDPDAVTMEFANDLEVGSVVDWQKKTGADIVLNGVYFHEDRMPSGILIDDGKRVGDRQFDTDKVAFIELHPKIRIVDTAVDSLRLSDVEYGAQSYPLLYKNGKPAIREDSSLTARRTFMAIDMDGFVYVGVVLKSDVSLYGLMMLLDGVQDWDEVVNLDGGPSSGVATSYGGSINSLTSIPNVILINEK